jgi:pantetheine-phosphate adenylyltransferase
LKKVALGGTFDHFHRGHKRLIDRAFETGRYVVIGITTDRLARELGKEELEPFDKRKRAVEGYIKREFKNVRYKIVGLNDPYGPVLKDPDIIGLVVSPETLRRGYEILKIREGKEMPLDLYVVPFVLAEDGLPISSSRIRKGEIDENGRLLRRNDL